MPVLGLWIAAAVCFLIAGCGSDRMVANVAGIVTYDGEPLSGATVTFQPTSGQRPGIGQTDGAGGFELGTYGVNDGAVVGDHAVTVVLREAGPEGMPKPGVPPGRPLIAERYFYVATSGLKAKVEDRRLNTINFDLTSKPQAQ
jgi:hypothetical protein